ncbi:MAG TPA: flotillin-like FloA family protein, partial [Aggregatilineales bacterium]|nr:flotillin-like FloA family protein [Aggregatilineales bacterium]
QAKAEERRAMAIAEEQEMRARVQEMRAKVVEAEAQIPIAVAEALRSGRIGVLDWYNLRNIEADTAMRRQIGGAGGPEAGGPDDPAGGDG